jgi:uncharacterized protein (TIGR00369 family)
VLHEVAPFAAWLGLEAISIGAGRAVLQMDPRPEILNRRGVVHGGALATLLDSGMARASRTLEGVTGLAGTTDLHVQFMRPAIGPLRAEAWVEHAGGTLAFCRGEVRDAAGLLVAAASGSMRLLR